MIEHVVPKHRCGVEIIFARLFVLLYLLAHKIMKFGYKMMGGVVVCREKTHCSGCSWQESLGGGTAIWLVGT